MTSKMFMDTKGYIYSISKLKSKKLYYIARMLYHSDRSYPWKSESNILYPTLKKAEKNLKEQALKNGWFGFKEM